jgi:hypothetical protein
MVDIFIFFEYDWTGWYRPPGPIFKFGGMIMEWWVWVLIAVVVVVGGAIKLSVLKKIMKNRANKKRFADD